MCSADIESRKRVKEVSLMMERYIKAIGLPATPFLGRLILVIGKRSERF
jgi:hypothetical protein